MFPAGHLWGISGHLWASLGISGHLWASLGISGHLWASLGISGAVLFNGKVPNSVVIELRVEFS